MILLVLSHLILDIDSATLAVSEDIRFPSTLSTIHFNIENDSN